MKVVDELTSTVAGPLERGFLVVDAVVEGLAGCTTKLDFDAEVTLPKAPPKPTASAGRFAPAGKAPPVLLGKVPPVLLGKLPPVALGNAPAAPTPKPATPVRVHPLGSDAVLATVRAVIVPDFALVPAAETHSPATTSAAVALTAWVIKWTW
ncbi:MAG: hypothetical protein ACRDY2_05400 [Acidimicrobiales bacterium]